MPRQSALAKFKLFEYDAVQREYYYKLPEGHSSSLKNYADNLKRAIPISLKEELKLTRRGENTTDNRRVLLKAARRSGNITALYNDLIDKLSKQEARVNRTNPEDRDFSQFDETQKQFYTEPLDKDGNVYKVATACNDCYHGKDILINYTAKFVGNEPQNRIFFDAGIDAKKEKITDYEDLEKIKKISQERVEKWKNTIKEKRLQVQPKKPTKTNEPIDFNNLEFKKVTGRDKKGYRAKILLNNPLSTTQISKLNNRINNKLKGCDNAEGEYQESYIYIYSSKEGAKSKDHEEVLTHWKSATKRKAPVLIKDKVFYYDPTSKRHYTEVPQTSDASSDAASWNATKVSDKFKFVGSRVDSRVYVETVKGNDHVQAYRDLCEAYGKEYDESRERNQLSDSKIESSSSSSKREEPADTESDNESNDDVDFKKETRTLPPRKAKIKKAPSKAGVGGPDDDKTASDSEHDNLDDEDFSPRKDSLSKKRHHDSDSEDDAKPLAQKRLKTTDQRSQSELIPDDGIPPLEVGQPMSASSSSSSSSNSSSESKTEGTKVRVKVENEGEDAYRRLAAQQELERLKLLQKYNMPVTIKKEPPAQSHMDTKHSTHSTSTSTSKPKARLVGVSYSSSTASIFTSIGSSTASAPTMSATVSTTTSFASGVSSSTSSLSANNVASSTAPVASGLGASTSSVPTSRAEPRRRIIPRKQG